MDLDNKKCIFRGSTEEEGSWVTFITAISGIVLVVICCFGCFFAMAKGKKEQVDRNCLIK